MKKAQLLAILLGSIFTTVFLSGCTLTANGKQVYFFERPAVGFTVEDEVTTRVDVQKQTNLSLEAQDGTITITSWDGDYLQIIEKRKLQGPSTRKSLNRLLEQSKCTIENTTFEINIKKEPEKDLKPLFRRTDDIELKIPEALKSIDIDAKSGIISISGIGDASIIDLTLDKGRIIVKDCKARKLYTTMMDGGLDVSGLEGNSVYKSGRGNIKLRDTTGSMELKSVSGETDIENAEGKLNCDISTGSLKIRSSRLKADSVFYVSYGDIDAELEGLDATGKYTIKASQGDIKLLMPEKTGWSLLAKSTGGRVKDNLNLTSGELKKAPSGEVYGNVGSGGPTVDVYVDNGDINLNKSSME